MSMERDRLNVHLRKALEELRAAEKVASALAAHMRKVDPQGRGSVTAGVLKLTTENAARDVYKLQKKVEFVLRGGHLI